MSECRGIRFTVWTVAKALLLHRINTQMRNDSMVPMPAIFSRNAKTISFVSIFIMLFKEFKVPERPQHSSKPTQSNLFDK